MKLPTQTKISIVRALLRGILTVRTLVGRTGTEVSCQRDGFRWELDISEGIDLAIYLFGRFEPATHKLLDRIVAPGMNVFDLGANIGAHTLALARRVGSTGRVISVEPTEWALEKLRRNVALNPDIADRITIIHGAILANTSDSCAPAAFYSSWSLTAARKKNDSFHPILGGFLRSAGDAQSMTVDQLVSSSGIAPDVLKIDVDGFELDVLTGAERTLRDIRPRLVVELCPYLFTEHGRSLAELLDILSKAQYRIYSERGLPLPQSEQALQADIPRGGGINVLAVPEELEAIPNLKK